jgi:hypothetical protein
MRMARGKYCSPRQECRTTRARSQNKQPVGYVKIRSELVEVIAHRVDHDEGDTKAYSEENPPCPHVCIEPIEQVGSDDSRDDHSL